MDNVGGRVKKFHMVESASKVHEHGERATPFWSSMHNVDQAIKMVSILEKQKLPIFTREGLEDPSHY